MKRKVIHSLIGSVLFFLLSGCDGSVELKVFTYQNNSVTGLYDSDTTLDGFPVSNVKLNVQLGSEIKYELETDTSGKLIELLPVPPLMKRRAFAGYIIATKPGYETDTLYFNHSSVDKRVAIIDMKQVD